VGGFVFGALLTEEIYEIDCVGVGVTIQSVLKLY
jgi:hypothetical protein